MLDRVKIGLVDAALQIQAEATTVARHADRGAYARAVLNDPEIYVKRMIYGVALDPNVQAAGGAVTDAQILAAALAMWNAYATVIITTP